MRIVCIGAGAAALTFSLLAAANGHDVDVFERRTSTPAGFGVVLWSDHLEVLAGMDRAVVEQLFAVSHEWSGQLITVADGTPVVVPGGGFGISRSALLATLEARAVELGVRLHHDRTITDASELPEHDLLVAADGAGSMVRSRSSEYFGATVTAERNRYAWFETDGDMATFQFPFVRAREDWMWAHVYPHRTGAHTFVVETTDRAWESERFADIGCDATLERLNTLFAAHLPSAGLRPLVREDGERAWTRFRRVTTRRWVRGRTVLLGDAAHTTHFSVGSGTRYAMEDAAALAAALGRSPVLESALHQYEQRRIAEMRPLQRVSVRSARFFEHLPRYIERSERDFVRLLQKRRSPLVEMMPSSAFVAVSRAADRVRGRALPY